MELVTVLLLFFHLVRAEGYQLPSHRRSIRSVETSSISRETLSTSSEVEVEITLVPSHGDPHEALLLKLSDPLSPEYGQYWTPQEVAKRFAPSVEHMSIVRKWLREIGVSDDQVYGSRGGSYISVHLNASEVEDIFSTNCYEYSYPESEGWVDCDFYELPEIVVPAVWYVAVHRIHKTENGTMRRADTIPPSTRAILDEEVVTFPSVPDSQKLNIEFSSTPIDSICGSYTTTGCLRQIYNIPDLPPTNNGSPPNASFGIYAQAAMTWLEDDLDSFFSQFEPHLVGHRPIFEAINGGYRQWDFNLTPFNLEANLDFQYSMGLTGLDVVDLQVGDGIIGGNLNTMLAAFDAYYCDAMVSEFDPIYPNPLPGGYNESDCGTVEPPKVISISFAWVEADFSEKYLEAQCLEILKLGLMGVTVVVSSGDSGTQAGVVPGRCIDPETGATDAVTGMFNPTWPASCPWITTVGGTRRSKENDFLSGRGEEAWRFEIDDILLSSSGGFSNVFPVPSYQQDAIGEYKALEETHFNGLVAEGYHGETSGRGFPDVSILAEAYVIYLYGELRSVHGTSASAPVFASMIALINSERVAAGKRSVGFVNPALYAHSEVFNDASVGSNEGCGAKPAYRATKGWDAVTGLGSVDYTRLRDVLLNLP